MSNNSKNLERNKSVGILNNIPRYSFKPRKKVTSLEKNYFSSKENNIINYSGNFENENKSFGFKKFQKKKKSIF